MTKHHRIEPGSKFRVRQVDADSTAGWSGGKRKTAKAFEDLNQRLHAQQNLLWAEHDRRVLVVLQGMDTSGKDGASRRMLEFVTPAGVETANFKTPTSEELAHDYLWRVRKALPRYGNIGVFNRSHYEDVLIVRVLNLKPRSVWEVRYAEINAFEKYLTENNVILLKFFLHISKAEQARRLQARLDDPKKNWKFEMNDIKMRAHWKRFQQAYEDAINLCSTTCAPWHIVPADHKWFRDYVIARLVVEAMEKLNMRWPRPKENLKGIRIK